MVITPFLTHLVTKMGGFTQKFLGHTGRMGLQRSKPKSQVLLNPPVNPWRKQRLPRIGGGFLAEDPSGVGSGQ